MYDRHYQCLSSIYFTVYLFDIGLVQEHGKEVDGWRLVHRRLAPPLARTNPSILALRAYIVDDAYEWLYRNTYSTDTTTQMGSFIYLDSSMEVQRGDMSDLMERLHTGDGHYLWAEQSYDGSLPVGATMRVCSTLVTAFSYREYEQMTARWNYRLGSFDVHNMAHGFYPFSMTVIVAHNTFIDLRRSTSFFFFCFCWYHTIIVKDPLTGYECAPLSVTSTYEPLFIRRPGRARPMSFYLQKTRPYAIVTPVIKKQVRISLQSLELTDHLAIIV
jgi:hypothetical protein